MISNKNLGSTVANGSASDSNNTTMILGGVPFTIDQTLMISDLAEDGMATVRPESIPKQLTPRYCRYR